jgi:uncharacterized membrane protein
MATVNIETREEKETGRIEAFSDGVFAIAITLLILEIRPPEDVESGEQLWIALGRLWPSYVAFFTSFATIGVMWMNHHRLFTYVRRADNALLFFNTLLLLGITVVPFPTALVAQYVAKDHEGTANVAAIVYGVMGLMLAIFFNLLWRHIAYWGRLLSKDTPPSFVEGVTRSYRLGPLFYVIAIVIALYSGLASFLYSMLLAVYFAVPDFRRVRR